MTSEVIVGVLLTGLCGALAVGEIIYSKFLLEHGWPYFRIGAVNMVIIAAVLGGLFLYSRSKLPLLIKMKWVIFRALASNGALIAAVLAVRAGAAPGDIAALTSINIVAAALLGHAFLGESLRRIHLLALVASITGAVLVARPEFLFARDKGDTEGSPWLGYSLALLSGLLTALIFICARKSAEESGSFLSSVEAIVGTVLFLLMPLASPTPGTSLSLVVQEPVRALGYLAALFGVTSLSTVTGCLGAQMCPAAVSATVMTASTMVTGYTAQTLLFVKPPRALTLVGAGIMLLAVVLMAATRSETPPEASEAEAEVQEKASDSGSILSFAASEFSQVPRDPVPVRRRVGEASRTTDGEEGSAAPATPGAQSIGAQI